MERIIPYIVDKIKAMFQTTNQSLRPYGYIDPSEVPAPPTHITGAPHRTCRSAAPAFQAYQPSQKDP